MKILSHQEQVSLLDIIHNPISKEERLREVQSWMDTITLGFSESMDESSFPWLIAQLRDHFDPIEILDILKQELNTKNRIKLLLNCVKLKAGDPAYATFILKLFDYVFHSSNNLELERIFSIEQIPQIFEYLKQADMHKFEAILPYFLEFCLNNFMPSYLLYVKNNFESHFNTFFEKLNPDKQAVCLELLEYKSPELASRLLNEFSNEFGPISLEGGLLALASIKNSKSYDVNPILMDYDSFPRFLEFLSSHLDAFKADKIKFILSGVHWTSGCIDLTGSPPKILLIDSLGAESVVDTTSAIEEIREAFPDMEIYLSKDVRQKSNVGCSVFAIDDCRHLHTIENYLPAAYVETGLFGYLFDHSEPSLLAGVEIRLSELPLPLMRLKQSRALFNDIAARPSIEQATPVNKAGEMPEYSSRKNFKWDVEDNKERNFRLEEKLKQTFKRCQDLLKYEDEPMVKKAMQSFTLDSFMQGVKHAHRAVNRFGLFANSGPAKIQSADNTKMLKPSR